MFLMRWSLQVINVCWMNEESDPTVKQMQRSDTIVNQMQGSNMAMDQKPGVSVLYNCEPDTRISSPCEPVAKVRSQMQSKDQFLGNSIIISWKAHGLS